LEGQNHYQGNPAGPHPTGNALPIVLKVVDAHPDLPTGIPWEVQFVQGEKVVDVLGEAGNSITNYRQDAGQRFIGYPICEHNAFDAPISFRSIWIRIECDGGCKASECLRQTVNKVVLRRRGNEMPPCWPQQALFDLNDSTTPYQLNLHSVAR